MSQPLDVKMGLVLPVDNDGSCMLAESALFLAESALFVEECNFQSKIFPRKGTRSLHLGRIIRLHKTNVFPGPYCPAAQFNFSI
jgi:hypothetical protein